MTHPLSPTRRKGTALRLCGLALSIALATPAFAETEDSRARTQFNAIRLGLFGSRMELEDQLPNPLDSCPRADGGPARCRSYYSRLFREEYVDIRIFIGYLNSEAPPLFLMDQAIRKELRAALLRPCGTHPSRAYFACDFREDASNGLLRRSVTGPDGKSQEVRVRIQASSLGLWDEQNRNDPRQAIASRDATDAFTDGLRHADVVLYLGHSRSGGGPDFYRPELRADGHTNYAPYKASHPGLQLTLAGLRQRDRGKLKLLGLLSCDTGGHFLSSIRQTAPDVGLIVSHELTGVDAQAAAALGTLNALLSFSSKSRFESMLNPLRITGGPGLFTLAGPTP